MEIVFKFIFMILVCSILVGCEEAPRPSSDSEQQYDANARIPVDQRIFDIEGQIVGDVDSLTRQSAPARGSGTMVGDVATASYTGATWTGKGVIRVLVESIEPSLDTVEIGQIVLLKTTDIKTIALLPGDRVSFRCRNQYEAIAAVMNNETFTADRLATWELDYCRLETPTITVERDN